MFDSRPALPCPRCAGTGFDTCEDRHAQTDKDVCRACGGTGMIAAETGATAAASFDPASTSTQRRILIEPSEGTEWTIGAQATPDGIALVIDLQMHGRPAALQILMDQSQTRVLSRLVLAAAGDAAERTVPVAEPRS